LEPCSQLFVLLPQLGAAFLNLSDFSFHGLNMSWLAARDGLWIHDWPCVVRQTLCIQVHQEHGKEQFSGLVSQEIALYHL
jgi:hypothetical protein